MEHRVDQVIVDGLVLMKILKHSRESPHEQVSGPLLGLVVDHKLEITNCFPYPRQDEDSEEQSYSVEHYQVTMMKYLREVNVDHLQVGWYQSCFLGGYLNEHVVSTQYEHQNSIEESVVLVYDPSKTAQGTLSIQAYRLRKKYMELHKKQVFTAAELKKNKLTFDQMFEKIPTVVRSSHLARALVDDLGSDITSDDTARCERLDLSTANFLEQNVHALMSCVDELSAQTQKYYHYTRNVSRQQQQQQQQQQKRRLENEARQEQGLEPLAEDEMANPSFKPIPAPSRLDTLLVNGQINNYCDQISKFTSQSFSKLFLAKGLQSEQF